MGRTGPRTAQGAGAPCGALWHGSTSQTCEAAIQPVRRFEAFHNAPPRQGGRTEERFKPVRRPRGPRERYHLELGIKIAGERERER